MRHENQAYELEEDNRGEPSDAKQEAPAEKSEAATNQQQLNLPPGNESITEEQLGESQASQ